MNRVVLIYSSFLTSTLHSLHGWICLHLTLFALHVLISSSHYANLLQYIFTLPLWTPYFRSYTFLMFNLKVSLVINCIDGSGCRHLPAEDQPTKLVKPRHIFCAQLSTVPKCEVIGTHMSGPQRQGHSRLLQWLFRALADWLHTGPKN